MTQKTEYYRFFQNRQCEYFPCHEGIPEEEFNCLFCYCPLYALGKRCGGSCTVTDSGIKSCMDCTFPHRRDNYDAVIARFDEIAAVAARSDAEAREIAVDDMSRACYDEGTNKFGK